MTLIDEIKSYKWPSESLVLKPEYKGQVIKVKGVSGMITFDTNSTDEDEYPLLHSLGFDFCFEPIEPKYKKPIMYHGIDLIKPNKKKNEKKVKTETEKE